MHLNRNLNAWKVVIFYRFDLKCIYMSHSVWITFTLQPYYSRGQNCKFYSTSQQIILMFQYSCLKQIYRAYGPSESRYLWDWNICFQQKNANFWRNEIKKKYVYIFVQICSNIILFCTFTIRFSEQFKFRTI